MTFTLKLVMIHNNLYVFYSFTVSCAVNKRHMSAEPSAYVKTKIVDNVLVITLDDPNSKVNLFAPISQSAQIKCMPFLANYFH